MSHYAIGDLQGCYAEFTALLNQIQFNPSRDTLWLVGDIVNRGPQSLECLQYCMRHESSVQIVLGNHDLHLLALMHGYSKLKHRDTLDSILNHPQMPQMRDWLRQQPLMRHTASHALVHAGIHPDHQRLHPHACAQPRQQPRLRLQRNLRRHPRAPTRMV